MSSHVSRAAASTHHAEHPRPSHSETLELTRLASARWPERLHEFDPVVKGVIDVDPPVPIQRLGTDSRSRRLKAFGEVVQALHDEGGMSLASRTELRVDTEMDLDTLILESAAASTLQMGQFGHAL